MDGYQKLDEISREALDDLDSGDVPSRPCQPPSKAPDRQNIHRAILPGGGTIPLLKTMLTSACEHNCNYCSFRAGRDCRRVTFTPDEMATTFLGLYQAGVVKGLFLSSGVLSGGVQSQDRILATAEILRSRYHFKGYMHIKLMPGIQHAQLEQAVRYADRVSINLEAPNPHRLVSLAPQKHFEEELVQPIHWLADLRRTMDPYHAWRHRWPSITTQYVIGGIGETDLELLKTTGFLTRQYHLARAYFSRFKPVRNTPLEGLPAANPMREVRLYQASYLLRDYGFDLEELSFDTQWNLPLACDPKLAWARANLTHDPIEINHAERPELLRVPGIGPRTADRLLRSRSRGEQVTEPGQLRRFGVSITRAVPFLLFLGKRSCCQPSLFDA